MELPTLHGLVPHEHPDPSDSGHSDMRQFDWITMEAVLTLEMVSSLSGGLERKTGVLGNLDLIFNIDPEKAGGWYQTSRFTDYAGDERDANGGLQPGRPRGNHVGFDLPRYAVSENWSVQPDLQYAIHPGTDPSVDNAVVLELRVSVGF